MYLECREGGSSKFWSAELKGKALHVQWGRIGTEGQKQVKQFSSPEKAKAELEKLLAAKTRTGYVPASPDAPRASASQPKASARAAKEPARSPRPPSAAPGTEEQELEQICEAIEVYFDTLALVEGLEVMPSAIGPEKASAISAFEKKVRLTLPNQARAFLQRGFRHATGWTLGTESAHFGFDFISLKHMEKLARIHRGIAHHYEDHDEDAAELLEHGLALSYSEPLLMMDCGPGRTAGAVSHFSTRNPLRPPVGSSLAEFLRHWLAAGCFASGKFPALWRRVEAHVPVKIPRKKNLWLRYYDAQFKTQFAR